MKLAVPDLVRQRAMSHGRAGRDWLERLPTVLEMLADRWDLDVGAPFPGGTAAYVVAATDRVGSQCVLKVAMPLDADEVASFRHAVIVHRLADGRGCARMLEHDLAESAILLERLGPNLDELGMPVEQILEVLPHVLRSFWRPASLDCGLPTGPAKAAWLAEFIETGWHELGRPVSRPVVDRAREYCATRAASFDPSQAVLVHGDAHGWNTVQAGDGTFKLVDPEGIVSEPAHDLAVPMREYNEPLLAGDTARLTWERAELLAERCDVDPEAVWQWGFIERVSTGLANLRDFGSEGASAFFEVAERCVAGSP